MLTSRIASISLLSLSCLALLLCFHLKPQITKPPRIAVSSLIEQFMLLALLGMLLWFLYLPLAPFSSITLQLLWLETQLICAGTLLRLYWYQRSTAAGKDAESVGAGTGWLIGYASQSGSAEHLARQSATQLQRAGFDVQVAAMNNINAAMLRQQQRALFIVSTYGEGEPPDNASQFFQQSTQFQDPLTHLHYAVLALGDRSYQQFCAFGHWLHHWLQQRQATALHPTIELDSTVHADSMQQWQNLLSDVTAANDIEPTLSTAPDWQQSTIISRYEVNPGSTGLPCFVVKLQTPANSHWQAGDLLDIQPQNSKCSVALWLTQHQLNGCQAVHYQQKQQPLSWALSELQLAAVSAPEPGQSLDDWLTKQPRLAARTYSIASIPEEGSIMLLVRQVKHSNGSLGAGSGWLTAWAAEQQPLQIRLRQHRNFHLLDSDMPIIFIGNGSGIAGIRALLAERVKRGQHENWLIFGERQQQTDAFFAKDLQQWQQQGFLPHCDLVFSQDQPEKRYVQHCLAQQSQQLDYWLQQGAAIYVCGSLHGMGQAIHQLLIEQLGEAAVTELQRQGRYRRDLY